MDGGPWQATVHRVAKHWTQLHDPALTQQLLLKNFQRN